MHLKKSPLSFVHALSFLGAMILVFLASCEEKDDRVRIPTYLISCTEDRVTMEAGEQKLQNLCVKILDADSVPMSGVKVWFSRVQGSVTFSDSVAVSNSDGLATTQMTPGTQSGDIVVKAQAEKMLKSPIHFTFHILSAVPAKIEVQSGNFQEALENVRLPNLVFLKVTDAFGNGVSNVPVSFKIKAGNGSLTTTSAVTHNGIATLQFTTGRGLAVSTIAATVDDDITTEVTVYTLLPVELSAKNKGGAIHLTWSKSISPNFKRYVVYGGTTSYNESVLSELTDINLTTFDHVITSVGFIYSYYIKVETGSGQQVDSDRKLAESGYLIELPYTYDSDICQDTQSGIFYIPSRREEKILIISTDPFEKTDSIIVRQSPYRIALSRDASKLYVTYGGQNTFDIIDLRTKSQIRTVDVSSAFGGGITDIYVTTNDQLFVAGARIVKVDESNNYSLQIVADNLQFAPYRPRFLADDGKHMYVEVSSHSPNSLFKIDISQANAPLVLEDKHGTVSGTANAILSPDGTRLYMSDGTIVLTSDFTSISNPLQMTTAVALSSDGRKIYTSAHSSYRVGALKVLDATSFVTEKTWEVGFVASRIFEYQDSLYIFAEVEIPNDVWRFYKMKLED